MVVFLDTFSDVGVQSSGLFLVVFLGDPRLVNEPRAFGLGHGADLIGQSSINESMSLMNKGVWIFDIFLR